MNGWVSVADELPEVGEDVLVYERHTSVPFVGWLNCDGDWIANKDFVECDGDCVISSNIVQQDVTYWMELPDNPMGDL